MPKNNMPKKHKKTIIDALLNTKDTTPTIEYYTSLKFNGTVEGYIDRYGVRYDFPLLTFIKSFSLIDSVLFQILESKKLLDILSIPKCCLLCQHTTPIPLCKAGIITIVKSYVLRGYCKCETCTKTTLINEYGIKNKLCKSCLSLLDT